MDRGIERGTKLLMECPGLLTSTDQQGHSFVNKGLALGKFPSDKSVGSYMTEAAVIS